MPGYRVKCAASPSHLLNVCRPILPRSFQQEAELRSQNTAAAHHADHRQAFLRSAYSRGCDAQAKGQHEQAVDAFAAAATAAPDFADAVQNLGFSLFALARFGEAAEACAKLTRLRPGDAGAHFNLGMALLSDKRPANALAALRSAARLDPRQAKHHQALAQALAALDRKAEAAAGMMKAAELDPDDNGLLINVTSLLLDAGDLNAAADAALLAVRRQPGSALAQGNLARALHGLGDSQAALAPARASARLAPMNAGAAATLGAVLYTLGHHAEALERCRHAAQLMPSLYQAKMNEALSLEALGRLDEAEAAARAALRLAPEAADVQHNLAAMLLASGRLTAESWGLYDARLRLPAACRTVADRPRWAGEDVAGKTVLLHCEQGYGDTLQFLRYAAMVTARGARVILAVQPALFRLLRDLPGVHAVVSADAPLPEHDVFCPLLSLPGVFGTTLDTIPPAAPCLKVDPTAAERWRTPLDGALKVGLVWAGSAVFVHDRARSVPIGMLAPLAGVPGVAFHSLQKPAQPTEGFPLLDRMAQAEDFADTAAIVAGLDLVISVDSAVAHLAASMGKEVWLLSRFVGCWRWLRNRADSPWYPTMRVFGQTAPGDWAGVVDRVREALVRRTAPNPIPIPPSVGEVAGAPRGTRCNTPAPLPEPFQTAGMGLQPSALDGLSLPDGAPRAVAVLVGENENGILRSVAGDFMALLPPHGLDAHVVSMADPGWLGQLTALLDKGLLFAWGPAGVGARLSHPDGVLWDVLRIPFISVLADSPAWMPPNHRVPSHYVANGYMYRDWLDMQRRLIRSPQLSALLPHGVAANPARDTIPWSRRAHRMLLVKTGCDPERHRESWGGLPPRFRTVVEETAAAALARGVEDISPILLDCLAQHDLYVEQRPDILFGLMQAVDIYVRDARSTALVRALIDLPVDIVGRGWEHLGHLDGRARFHAPVDASTLPGLYADTQYLLNTMPNFSSGTHERVIAGFAAKCCVITNENAQMAQDFGSLPSYFGIDTRSADLAERLAARFHGEEVHDDDVGAAAALADAHYPAAGFMRGLVDLALEVRSAAAFAQFRC